MKEKSKTASNRKTLTLPPPDEIMSASEAAEYLKIHRSTVTRWIAEGRLHGYKIGAKLLVKRSSLADFLAANEV